MNPSTAKGRSSDPPPRPHARFPRLSKYSDRPYDDNIDRPSINTRTNRSKMSTFEPVVRIPRYRTASARHPHDLEDTWKMVQNSNG